MKKQTGLLLLFVLLVSIIAAHNSFDINQPTNLKQTIKASLAIDTSCIDRSKINYRSCPQVYEPVCGCDGRTYWTSCHAEREGVISWKKGSCRQLVKVESNTP